MHNETAIYPSNRIYTINIMLAAAAVLLLGFSIFYVNKTSDLDYKIRLLRNDLRKENAVAESLTAEGENLDAVAAYAREHGMVVVDTYDSFFQQSGVALGK